MLKKVIITLAIILILVVMGIVLSGYLMTRGPDMGKYMHLREPQLVAKPDQTMLVVEAAGDPNAVGAKAFGLLYKAYFKNAGGKAMVPPRARWPQPLETPMAEWTGLYALPVGKGTKLDGSLGESGLRVYIGDWKYGEVAEILHVGPYDKEAPTVELLKGFILDKGYRICGPHEEEYLRGPGMFGKGDPNKYYTIIRYQVEPLPPGGDSVKTPRSARPGK